MVDGYPVGFELVIGRAEDDPPAVFTPHVVEFVPADSHICVMIVSHVLWPIGMRSCLCGAHRSLGVSPTLVIGMPSVRGPRWGPLDHERRYAVWPGLHRVATQRCCDLGGQICRFLDRDHLLS
jgi:hypothetical protein